MVFIKRLWGGCIILLSSLKDPLEDCITVLTRFYSIRGDIQATVSELHTDNKIVNRSNVKFIAEKLSCKIDEISVDIDGLKKLQIPVILLLKNDESRIYFPQSLDLGLGELYNPGIGASEESLEDISDLYTKTALIFIPPKSEVQARVDHMMDGMAIDWFWDPVRKNWKSYIDILLCSLFINILVLVMPLYTMNIYDRVVTSSAKATLVALTIGIVIALLFDFTFKITRAYVLEKLSAHVGIKYDSQLMERLLLISPYNMAMSVGERVNIFRELQTIRDFFASRFIPMVVDIPFFALFCFVIYLISKELVWVPITGMVVIVIINLMGRAAINRSTKGYFSSMQAKTTAMIETLSGTATIQMFNAIGKRLFKWNFETARSAEAAEKNHIIISFVSNLSFLVSNFVNVFIVFFGVYLILRGDLTVGGLIASTILSGRAMAPIMASSGVLAQLRQSMDVLITIDKIFKLPYQKRSSKHVGVKGDIKGNITLKSVTAKYPRQESDALVNISLNIKAGEHVGIIGRTGAGKSTLIKLISGVLPAENGQVFFDNYNQKSIPATELRRIVGIVPQDSFFFSGSIEDNVLLGEETVSEEVLKKAIHYSGLDLVMEQTGNGLDTEVGEDGSSLSGGQKQAISLARCFVRDPSILIFDEPTTGMDTVLENRIKASMSEFLKGKTFIMVTHRTSLLSLVDRLILLDNGRILADGPRDEVLRKISGKG